MIFFFNFWFDPKVTKAQAMISRWSKWLLVSKNKNSLHSDICFFDRNLQAFDSRLQNLLAYEILLFYKLSLELPGMRRG